MLLNGYIFGWVVEGRVNSQAARPDDDKGNPFSLLNASYSASIKLVAQFKKLAFYAKKLAFYSKKLAFCTKKQAFAGGIITYNIRAPASREVIFGRMTKVPKLKVGVRLDSVKFIIIND